MINGAKGEPVTYLFDLTLGFDFATAAQLVAVLRRVDSKQDFTSDPLDCLFDHSCVMSEQASKNEQSINVILT